MIGFRSTAMKAQQTTKRAMLLCFVMFAMLVCAVVATPNMAHEDIAELQAGFISEHDHVRMFHATVDLIDGAFPGMLPQEQHNQFEDSGVAKGGERTFDGGGKSITEHLAHKVFGDKFAPTDYEAEQKKLDRAKEVVATRFTHRDHSTVIGLASNGIIPESSTNDDRFNAIHASVLPEHSASVQRAIKDADLFHKRIEAPITPDDNPLLHKSLVREGRVIGKGENVLGGVLAQPKLLSSTNSNGSSSAVVMQGNGNTIQGVKRDIQMAHTSMMKELTVSGVEQFGAELKQRTLRLVMEESHVSTVRDRHGRDIGAKSESTFFIMMILKLIIAPFVCIILMIVVTPGEGGMKNAGGTAITEGAGPPLIKMLAQIIGFMLGLLMAYVMGSVISEACTFQITITLTFVICNNIFEQTAMDTVDNLQHFFMNTLLPSLQVEVLGYVMDILSDALSSALHHTLTRSVSTRLSKTLTPATLHYYYCVYCYYYGDYCNQCFHNNEQSIIDQLTWTNFGS
eukprot:c11713_g2_i2.p1 GENE.c11713_g2_i2~~c11713_g2_i2.p1  ORF type:complete len:555 (+),score=157.43 c11713_g2_i2:131-1666(+)